MDSETHRDCGGTIVEGDIGGHRPHRYCDRCHAFREGDGPLPSGRDREANHAAWDDGETSSPDQRAERAVRP